jgi:uncharacterized delta-60 repeat protein
MIFGGVFPKKKYYSILALASLLALLFNTNALALVTRVVLDDSFDGDGKVTTPLGRTLSMILQPDGKIVVAGGFYCSVLARYNSDGSLDATFGEDGKVITDFGGAVELHAIALQPDGRILATGRYRNSTDFDILLARYNSDGSLDATFDGDGKVTTDFPGTWGDSDEEGDSVVIQADGKILVGGYSIPGFALVRYNPDGSLDPTFGNGGVVTTWSAKFGRGWILSLALQPDGKIVAAGGGYAMDVLSESNSYNFALARYHSNGSLDTTFGSDGTVSTDLSNSNDTANSIAIQPDGKIIVVGVRWKGIVSDFALVRYRSNGSLDTTFDADGKVTTDFGSVTDIANAVVVQPDGKLIVAGMTYNGLNSDFIVARYNTNGSLDTTFNTVGSVITDFNNSDDWAYAVALPSDDKIVVAGYSGGDAALARYTEADIEDGSPGSPVSFTDPIFKDVSSNYWSSTWINRLFLAGITGGCGTDPLLYCPEASVTRAQMAIFLERGMHGSSYAPPAVEGDVGFGDVPVSHWAGAWIKQLAADGITGGCGSGNYCPEAAVTRAEMAVFLLKAKYGAGYAPPSVQGGTGFSDVPATHWAAAWMRQLAVEGITGGCGNGIYCPEQPVTRAQMAVFLVRTFNLP